MPNRINLLDLIKKEKLDEILKGFTELTGLAAIITDVNGHPITEAHNFTTFCETYCRSTEEGRQKCYKSDSYGGAMAKILKKAHVYKCLNGGLNDCAAPIIVEGIHLANFLCGQVRDKNIVEDEAISFAVSIGIEDLDGYLEELRKVRTMSGKRLLAIANFMSVMTQTISESALQKIQLVKQSKKYLNRLINSISDPIIGLNGDSRIIMANDACIGTFGYQFEELRGKPIMKLFSDDLPVDGFPEQMESKNANKTHDVVTAMKADGQPFPVQVSLSKVGNYNGKGGSDYVLVLRDISEEKKVERMKEDLVGMLTHDMGNPVLAIQKTLQIFLEENLGPLLPKQKEIMEMALVTSRQLYGMVTNLLDIYSSDNGQFSLRKTPFDMRDIISDGVNLLEIFSQEKQITIHCELPPDPINLSGDRSRLRRACLNLISNAIKYSPNGGKISITSRSVEGKGKILRKIFAPSAFDRIHPVSRYILTTIEDNGFGIPVEYQQAIFEKFFTIKPRDGEGRRGLGLGLAFCKLVIEAHGGVIVAMVPPSNAKKGQNRGCQFQFLLPVE
jgi:PAS domain S-box-containing protein